MIVSNVKVWPSLATVQFDADMLRVIIKQEMVVILPMLTMSIGIQIEIYKRTFF